MYIQQDIQCKLLSQPMDNCHEVIWAELSLSLDNFHVLYLLLFTTLKLLRRGQTYLKRLLTMLAICMLQLFKGGPKVAEPFQF